jgi:response regulator RpfG family c-di-GMP phosphodiesterase
MTTERTSQPTPSTLAPTTSFLTNRRFVLIVDDDTAVLSIAVDILSNAGYQCLTARSASQALITLKNPDYRFDVMISDVVMSGMNGIDLMKHAVQLLPDLPVIIMSGASEVQTPVEALRAGSADYLIKPFDHDELLNCVSRTLTKKTDSTARSQAQSQAANWQTAAKAFALSLDARDKETEGHAERVVAYSVRLGQQLGLSSYDLILVELGARLHDIGKIAVPDHVLKKPAPLNEDEWKKMRLHPAKGQEMVLSMGLPEASALIVGQHHEQWNGTGYPLGLKQEEISIGARIFSVVDTFDAITSDRVYRRGRPYQDALEEILKFSGTQFDPAVVDAFAQVEPEEWEALRRQCPSQQHAIAC